MWQLNLVTDHSGFSCRSFSILWQLNLVTDHSGFSCRSFSILWQLNLVTDHSGFSCRSFSILWQLNLVTDHSGFSCRSFSILWQLNLVTDHSGFSCRPFLTQTVISRHDARLSSTTHCALRASRIIYNLTNLSRCYSFLLSIWTYAAPCRTAQFPSNSFQCSLVILQALSLTLGQNHQAS